MRNRLQQFGLQFGAKKPSGRPICEIPPGRFPEIVVGVLGAAPAVVADGKSNGPELIAVFVVAETLDARGGLWAAERERGEGHHGGAFAANMIHQIAPDLIARIGKALAAIR